MYSATVFYTCIISLSDMKRSEQILLVDDNIVMLRFLSHLLSDKYIVVCKTNAIEAFRWLEDGNYPSIIISDLMVPGMENLSFVKNIKMSGFYRKTPLILLSEVLQSENALEEITSRVDAYFHKPFNPELLKDTISNLLIKYYAAA